MVRHRFLTSSRYVGDAAASRAGSSYRILPTPIGCAAANYPEANVLIALDHHGLDAQTPAAKAIPIRLERSPQHDR